MTDILRCRGKHRFVLLYIERKRGVLKQPETDFPMLFGGVLKVFNAIGE
jgi:hypothetical protein